MSATSPAENPSPSPSPDQSAWRGRQLYSAQFSLSDLDGDRFYPYERYSRGGLGLAGAQAKPYQVWLNDWSTTALDDGQVQLVAQSEDIGELTGYGDRLDSSLADQS